MGTQDLFQRGFLYLAVAFSVSSLGCAPEGKKTRPPQDAGLERPLIEGDLTKEVRRIYDESKWYGNASCDTANRAKLLEVASELERRREEIDALTQAAASSEAQGKLEKWGKYSFGVLDGPRGQAPDTWKQQKSSWEPILGYFESIRNSPTDKRWVALNYYVRGLLVDDDNRLFYGANMSMDRDQQPTVEGLVTILHACQKDEACVSVTVTPEQLNYINAGGGTKYNYDQFMNPRNSVGKRRGALKDLVDWVEYDSDRYGFVVYNKVTKSNGMLHFPMNASVFEQDAVKFKKFVESIWNTDANLKIDIQVVDDTVADVFKIFVGGAGGRAYVQHSESKMQLYEYDEMAVAAHEFGHVIGFRDYYYTTFSNQSCQYTVEYNQRDIMSAGDTVLDSHWELIKARY